VTYAEDAVQSAWLKASRADHDRIENLDWLVHGDYGLRGTRRVTRGSSGVAIVLTGRVQALLQISTDDSRIRMIDYRRRCRALV
jgi:hypothetical protein